MKQNALLLAGVYIFKAPEGDDEWNYKWKKDIEGENLKNNIFVWEIHFSKYQLIKNMYKIITSLVLQKSLKTNCNSGIQPN